MYRFFVNPPSRSILTEPSFKTIKNNFFTNYDRLYDYQVSINSFIEQNNVLVRLLKTYTFSPEATDEWITRYMFNAERGICTAVGISCDSSYGKWHYDTLYCKWCGLVSVRFRDVVKSEDWRNIRPFRVFTHPHASMRLQLATLMYTDDPSAYAIVGIDLTQLAIMLKGWLRFQLTLPEIEREDVSQLLVRYILPNMWPEQVDIGIRNIAVMEVTGESIRSEIKRSPRHQVDQTTQVRISYRDLIDRLNTGKRTMSEVTKALPLLFGESWQEAIPKNVSSGTRYTYWASMMVYVDWLTAILVVCPTIDTNQENIKTKASIIHRYVKGADLLQYVSKSHRELFTARYNSVISRLGH